jgi:phosphoglucosamine mutase
MSPDVVLKLGQAIGLYFKKHHANPKILIGKDTRRSGYMLEQALGAGICSVGVDVQQLGPLPTPGIAYLTRGLRACAGIVISASHNPFQDNGIKIFNYDGYKLPDDVEDELERMLGDDLSSQLYTGMEIGKARRIDDAIGQYAVFLKEQFPKHLTLEGLRIVLDCANGAGYKVAPKVFEELGAEIFTIGVTPNGRNINDGSGALHPNHLRDQVRLYKADVGIALDGDADRLMIVDDTGEIVDGDQVMAICGSEMIREGTLAKNTVVATIMSNMGLELALSKVGGTVVRTKVGDRYVVEEMKRNDYNLGGEQSGHLVFRNCSTTGDGILAALNLLKIVVGSQKKVSELKRCMEHLPQLLKNVKVRQKIPLENMPELKNMIDDINHKLGKTGRVIFRYSGTENLARIMVEGESEADITRYCDDICKQLETEIALLANKAEV